MDLAVIVIGAGGIERELKAASRGAVDCVAGAASARRGQCAAVPHARVTHRGVGGRAVVAPEHCLADLDRDVGGREGKILIVTTVAPAGGVFVVPVAFEPPLHAGMVASAATPTRCATFI
jgi:hypothetical protein